MCAYFSLTLLVKHVCAHLRENGRPKSYLSLQPEFITCRLRDKEKLSHNTYLYTLETPCSVYMGIPIGFHVYVKISGNLIIQFFIYFFSNNGDFPRLG